MGMDDTDLRWYNGVLLLGLDATGLLTEELMLQKLYSALLRETSRAFVTQTGQAWDVNAKMAGIATRAQAYFASAMGRRYVRLLHQWLDAVMPRSKQEDLMFSVGLGLAVLVREWDDSASSRTPPLLQNKAVHCRLLIRQYVSQKLNLITETESLALSTWDSNIDQARTQGWLADLLNRALGISLTAASLPAIASCVPLEEEKALREWWTSRPDVDLSDESFDYFLNLGVSRGLCAEEMG